MTTQSSDAEEVSPDVQDSPRSRKSGRFVLEEVAHFIIPLATFSRRDGIAKMVNVSQIVAANEILVSPQTQ